MAAFQGWKVALLRSIGAPVTQSNMRFLDAWQRAEGGSANFNPLNTTQRANGASNYNGVGVKNFTSPGQGVQATSRTLLNGKYPDLVRLLRSGKATPQQLGTAVAHSPWGTGSGVLRVLGSAPTALPKAPNKFTVTRPALGDTKQMFAQHLLSAASRTAAGQAPDFGSLIDLAQQRKQLQAAEAAFGPTPQAGKAFTGTVTIDGKVTKTDRNVVALAQKYLGTPYVWGGTKPGGFDCSGLLQYVYGKAGVNIPRVTYDQWKSGSAVGRNQLRAGDAVFFHPGKNGPEHVGMYIGNGKFIEAPRTGLNVRISNLAGRKDYMGARRFG